MSPITEILQAAKRFNPHSECRCGETAYTTERKRSLHGRGRPYLTQISCASCGYPIGQIHSDGWLGVWNGTTYQNAQMVEKPKNPYIKTT